MAHYDGMDEAHRDAAYRQRIAELEQELAAAKVVRCRWDEDEDGNWDTGCNQKHIFITGTPSRNRFVFCPYCRGRIDEKKVMRATRG
jgi:hypothetical protein